MPTVAIPEKLTPVIERDKRVKLITGGRGGGKTIAVSDLILMKAAHGQVICCAREFQNSIDDSVHSTLCNEIDRLNMEGFEIQNTRIYHRSGGEIFYKGLARNLGGLKSLREVDVLWVEEAEYISSKSLELLIPSVRSVGGEKMPEIWFTMNRGSSADPIAQKYLKRADATLMRGEMYEDDILLAIQINYYENPWFSKELELERVDDKREKSRAFYRHKWLGDYNDEVENAIIPQEWFDAAIDAHIKLGFKPRGKVVVAHDPSDEGPDPKGLCKRHGQVILDVRESHVGNVNDGCDWATDYAIHAGADCFVWDGDGMGVTLRRQVADSLTGKKIDQEMFRGSFGPDRPDAVYQHIDDNAAKPATNKDTFKNKRSQYYWMLRDRFYNAYRAVVKKEYVDPDEIISLSSDIEIMDALRAEVCRIPLKRQGSGLIQIMSKDDMLRLLDIRSPNLSDCLMMSLAIPDKIVNRHAHIPPPIKPMGQKHGFGRNQRTR